jgi:PPIC-type PPIASE domain
VKVLKEPLLHFLLAGALLFGVYGWLNRPAENPSADKARQIQVSAGDVAWLAENWTRQWQRPPTREELRGLAIDYLNEQLLAREARAMGLDEDDVIVRRRLAQKLTFLIDNTLRRAEPSDSVLQEFYERNGPQFQSDARISFAHIFFSRERRTDAQADAAAALQRLRDSGAASPPEELGDRSLIEPEFRDVAQQAVAGAFGSVFAQAVFALEPGNWTGPIESGYGLHLVRVFNRRQAEMRPLPDVRARVIEEWRREQEKSAQERYLVELSKKYNVVVDDAVKPLIAPATPEKAADQ